MEYEFIRNTLMREYYVKCTMGHEVLARWLQEEIGKDKDKIQQVIELIDLAKQNPTRQYRHLGKETHILIEDHEVHTQENGLDQEVELIEDFNLYDSESSSVCGLIDFESLVVNWLDFISQR